MIQALVPIFLINGVLLATLGGSMFFPAIIDLIYQNKDWEIFAFTGTLCMLIGLGLFFSSRGSTHTMSTRQAFVMTASTWIILVLFGAIPFYLSGIVPSFTDAFFESMSALTTTGSTVISGLESAPPGILLWRGIQQWLGGLGIIVMAVSVLPMLQIGGMQLFKIEAFDTPEKIMPRATQISGSLTIVFIFFTGLCMVAYLAAGMDIFDAVVHGMTTVATGGLSTKDDSIAHFQSDAIELVAIVFMIIGSIPFLLYVQGFQGKPHLILKNSQVRVFLGLVATCTVIGWILHPEAQTDPGKSLLHAAFNVTSIVTGTGYSSTDYGQWHVGTTAFFFVIMFIGGCAGSTSCGIKVFRFQIVFETVKQHLAKVFYPNGIFTMRYNGNKVDDQVSAAVMNFFAVYFLLFGVCSILLNLTGLDFITSISAAGTAISNVGPGLGEMIGPSGNFQEVNNTAKWILSAAMLIGRLELFTILVLFMPRFWRT